MNYYQEYFISKYVNHDRRERLIYELNSKKKKFEFMNHFCHDTRRFIIPERIAYVGNVNDALSYIKNNDTFFVMKYDDIEGRMMNKNEFITCMKEEYMSIIAILKDLVIIKEETENTSLVFVLKE